MRLWVLGSGSKGNALLLESGDHRLLVDAGFGPRTLAQRLRTAGVDPCSIAACILTHEHGDHVRGAGVAATKWGWQLHATTGTVRGCTEPLPAERVHAFRAGTTLELDGFSVETHASPHDASSPVCLVVTSRGSGARAGIAYDLGHVPERFTTAFTSLELLVIEANHDEQMLWNGRYPPSVKARVAGRNGHLSNGDAGMFARQCSGPALRQVVLAHLSEHNNEPELAVRTVRRAMRGGRGAAAVQPAPQHAVLGPISVDGRSVSAGGQLTLDF